MTLLSFIIKENQFYQDEYLTVRDMYRAVTALREHAAMIVDEVRILGYRKSNGADGQGNDIEYKTFLSEISLMSHYEDDSDRDYRPANKRRLKRWIRDNRFDDSGFRFFGLISPENQDVQVLQQNWMDGAYIGMHDDEKLLEVIVHYDRPWARRWKIIPFPIGEAVFGFVSPRECLERNGDLERAEEKIAHLTGCLGSMCIQTYSSQFP